MPFYNQNGKIYKETPTGAEYVSDPNTVNWNDVSKIDSILNIPNPGESIINSPEYTDALKTQAVNRYAPGLSSDLSTIASNRNQLELNLQGLTNQETQANRQYDTLGENLNKQAKSFQDQQAQLGLLQSGGTSSGLQELLVKQKGMNEQDRSSALASLAIQRAGIGIQQGQLSNQEVNVKNQNTQNVNDYVSQLMGSAKQNIKERQTQIISTGNRELLVDTKTGETIKDLGPTSYAPKSGSSSSAPEDYAGTVPYKTASKYVVKTQTGKVNVTVPNEFGIPKTESQIQDTGLLFYNDKKAPISVGQFARDTGTTMEDLLSNSPNQGDQQAVIDIRNGMSDSELRKKYPWMFTGV